LVVGSGSVAGLSPVVGCAAAGTSPSIESHCCITSIERCEVYPTRMGIGQEVVESLRTRDHEQWCVPSTHI
jgi:hypothetical protein